MFQLFINEDRKETNHFTVKNQSGKILYLIEGYWGKKGDTVNLFNIKGQLILQARQVNISPFFHFSLFHKGNKIGSFRKHPGFFGLRDAFFTLQPKDWITKGNFEKMHFTTYENEKEIIKTNKLLKNANYLYSLKVKREKDKAFASLISILLDHYSRKKKTEVQFNKNLQKDYNLGFTNYQMNAKDSKKESSSS